jgi:hypothetical protein
MARSNTINEPQSWVRIGDGKELQFFATDLEVQNWLEGALLSDYAPYYFVGSDLEEIAKRSYRQTPFRLALSELPAHLRRYPDRFNYWLLSEVLTPDLDLKIGDPITNLCGFHGLILLQHGLRIKVPHISKEVLVQDSSRIAIVTQFRNLRTNEIMKSESYLPIFENLKKTIKKDLVYATVQRFPDGHEEEDIRTALMTEGAARSYEEGFPFICRPGRRLKPRPAL